MLTVVYRIKVKEGFEETFNNIALQCEDCAHKSDGCISYTFFRSITGKKDFIVHYKFLNIEEQTKHIENLRKVLGPPPEGRDLPKKFIDCIEDEELILFDRGEE